MTEIEYPCGCKGIINFYFPENGFGLLNNKGIRLHASLDKICLPHQADARVAFIDNVNKQNEDRIRRAENDPVSSF